MGFSGCWDKGALNVSPRQDQEEGKLTEDQKHPIKQTSLSQTEALLKTLALTGKDQNPTLQDFQFFKFAMGTRFNLTLRGYDQSTALQAAQMAFNELIRIENRVSSWIPTSEIGQLNLQAGKGQPLPISWETHWLLSKGQWISKQTRGSFDLTWAALKGLWDFKKRTIPLHSDLSKRLKWVGSSFLELNPPVIQSPSAQSPREPFRSPSSSVSSASSLPSPKSIDTLSSVKEKKRFSSHPTAYLTHSQNRIDLGGIAKGYAVDQMAWVLKKLGYRDFIVDGGGDLYVHGSPKKNQNWRVGVQHPRTQSTFVNLKVPSGWAVVSSGDYERFFVAEDQRWHHIIDLRTGYPAQGCVAITVLAASTLEADAYATALFILGPREGLKLAEQLPHVEALFFAPTGEIRVTSGFSAFLSQVPKYWKK